MLQFAAIISNGYLKSFSKFRQKLELFIYANPQVRERSVKISCLHLHTLSGSEETCEDPQIKGVISSLQLEQLHRR